MLNHPFQIIQFLMRGNYCSMSNLAKARKTACQAGVGTSNYVQAVQGGTSGLALQFVYFEQIRQAAQLFIKTYSCDIMRRPVPYLNVMSLPLVSLVWDRSATRFGLNE